MKHRLAPVGAVALAMIVAATPAAADNGGRRARTLTAQTANAGPLVQHAPACDATGQCIGSYSSANTVTGDLVGTLAVEGTVRFVVGNTTAQQQNLQLFNGTVEGCGTGSFVIALPFQPISLVAPSLSTDLTIVQGSGTGDLSHIRGRATASFAPDPNGGGVGGYVLKVQC